MLASAVLVQGVAAGGRLLVDAFMFPSLDFRSRSRLAAENLSLRERLALYAEGRVQIPQGQ